MTAFTHVLLLIFVQEYVGEGDGCLSHSDSLTAGSYTFY